MPDHRTKQCCPNLSDAKLTRTDAYNNDQHPPIERHDVNIGTENPKGCMECHQTTTKMCQQCSLFLCDSCFAKMHKEFNIFKNHVLQDIELIKASKCNIHQYNPMGYYCNDCKKPICMDCFMVGGDKNCKGHNVTTLQEMNSIFMEEIKAITPNVDETFRRLTKTAGDIGDLLYDIENETGTSSEWSQIISNIDQHFSKLNSVILKHKREVMDKVAKLRSEERESLYDAKNEVARSMKKAEQVMDYIRLSQDPKEINKINLALLLNDAKNITEVPWYLDNGDKAKEPFKVSANEDMYRTIYNYLYFEGQAPSRYKLYARSTAPILSKDASQDEEKPKPKEKDVTDPRLSLVSLKHRNNNSVTSLKSCASASQTSYLTDQASPGVQDKPLKKNLPKELQRGCKELVYVTNIVDPQNFYVQKACHQQEIKDILNKFRNAVSLPTPSENDVTKGKAYLALNEADNTWQRCRVNRVDRSRPDRPQFHVFSYDFGTSRVVGVDGLRELAHELAVTPSPLAIHCALANCVPKNGTWMDEDTVLVQNIIANKQVVMHVREAPAGQQLVCDIIMFEDGVSVAHALLFHERATMPDTQLKYPDTIGVMDRPKIHMSYHEDYKPKSVHTVIMTHVVSPDKFYVQKPYQQAALEQLNSELEEEYSFGLPEHVYLPEVGMAVAVRVEDETSGWARGVIVGLPGGGTALVRRVDSGAPLQAHWSLLRPLRSKFAVYAALALECHLAGVTPLDKQWQPASAQLLRKYVGRPLQLRVEENRRGCVGVALHHAGSGLCLNRQMIDLQYAVPFGMFSFNCHTEERVPNTSNTDKYYRPLDKPTKARARRDRKKNLTLKKTPPPLEKDTDLEAINKGLIRLEAKLLHCHSPSLIYVTLAHQHKMFFEMFAEIQAYYYKNRPMDIVEWKAGDMCCTVASKSKTWQRAFILELDDKQAKVFYSDFADVETVTVKSLRALPEKFASIGDAAVKCHLHGLMPATGKEWPSITEEFLKELMEAYNKIFITQVGDLKNKSMPVEVWVYHTVRGGALDPDRSEWRCLNRRIIDQGLAIPDRSLQVKGVECEEQPTPNVSAHTSSLHVDYQLVEASHVFTDWLPPEPLDKRFIGMPTYIDDEGVIYLQDVQKRDKLRILRKALDDVQLADRKDEPVKWTVGKSCIALCGRDERRYRGRVVALDRQDDACTVHYVDYGHEERCWLADMRACTALRDIPTLAYKCVLSGVRPAAGRWEGRALDYLRGTLLGNRCRVTVVADDSGRGLIPILITCGKVRINNTLVELQMAKYEDGSKATVPNVAPTDPALGEHSATVSLDSQSENLVEDDDIMSDSSSLHGKMWCELEDSIDDDYDDTGSPYYPKLTDTQFKCTISVINDYNSLELSILHDQETVLRFEKMSEDMQKDVANMPVLRGDEMYDNQPCIALYHEDNLWYRALLMVYSEEEQNVKVKFVDYGNVEIVRLENVRQINKDWAQLTPATITVQLNGLHLNPDVETTILTQEYKDIFLNKSPFHVTVIKNEPVVCVELRNDKEELIYQNLIDKGILVKCDSNCEICCNKLKC